jgi:hypothetical protein
MRRPRAQAVGWASERWHAPHTVPGQRLPPLAVVLLGHRNCYTSTLYGAFMGSPNTTHHRRPKGQALPILGALPRRSRLLFRWESAVQRPPPLRTPTLLHHHRTALALSSIGALRRRGKGLALARPPTMPRLSPASATMNKGATKERSPLG